MAGYFYSAIILIVITSISSLLSWHRKVNPFQLWKELLIIILIDVFLQVSTIHILYATVGF